MEGQVQHVHKTPILRPKEQGLHQQRPFLQR